MEFFNWKENKEVGTGKDSNEKTKNIYVIFLRKFPKKIYLFLDSTILFWKKTKIFMETLLYRQKATEK